jgi:hypothetical protein
VANERLPQFDPGSAMPLEMPPVFLWSRIGPEGGFTLDQIVYWKEVQRLVGDGIFWWGIGNAPAKEKVKAVLQQPSPTVLFSVQKKQEHGERRQRILWTTYIDTDGTERKLGEHVYIERIDSRTSSKSNRC